ncbi:MAG: type III secretion protein [Gammaproteobacteria bacterium HGW-Gammaproteobacteria-12]|jgi:energy-converting hydrogenase A subunit M|nr:MAG: type III secretion protein [Gammaproteobacteria bacterium HGW-Gammaproteobacteria-12]
MSSLEALRNRLDRAQESAARNKDEALLQAAESADINDMHAYNEAARKAQLVSSVVSEELRAQHGLTKAIIDGIQ